MENTCPELAIGQERTPGHIQLLREAVLLIVIVAVFLGFIVGVSLLLGLASVNVPPQVLDIDVRLYRAMAEMRNQWLTEIVFTFFNDPGVDYTVPIAACLAYVWWRRRRDMVPAVVALSLTLIVGAWTIPYTQQFGFRPRPFMIVTDVQIVETWRQIWSYVPTFPSGHIRELSGLCVVLGYFWARARLVVAIYLVFIALTRVYIGAHFPTDVLAGIIVGLLAGSFSVTTVHRGTSIVSALAQTKWARGIYDYVFQPQRAGESSDPVPARVIRSVLVLGLVLAIVYALGSLVYIQSPRILADYLRNTDNSLVYPILSRFDPDVARIVYQAFDYAPVSYSGLAILIFGYGAFRGKRGLGRAAFVLILTVAIAEVTAMLISPHFERPRPLGTGEVELPEIWTAHWPGPASFPDQYLLMVMALGTALARLWRSVAVPAYLYPVLVAASLLYFGAAWPLDALATLVAGFLVGRCALFLAEQVAPRGWRTERP